MNMSLAELTERLVPISDFSQGKAGKIFNDVAENNQPTAVLISLKEYKESQKKIGMLEKLLERINDAYLLKLAQERDGSEMTDFDDFIEEQGYSMDEIDKLVESVEIE